MWVIPISFRQKRSPRRSASDCSRLRNYFYRKQSDRKNIRLSGIMAIHTYILVYSMHVRYVPLASPSPIPQSPSMGFASSALNSARINMREMQMTLPTIVYIMTFNLKKHIVIRTSLFSQSTQTTETVLK